jgi:hypothetical protein
MKILSFSSSPRLLFCSVYYASHRLEPSAAVGLKQSFTFHNLDRTFRSRALRVHFLVVADVFVRAVGQETAFSRTDALALKCRLGAFVLRVRFEHPQAIAYRPPASQSQRTNHQSIMQTLPSNSSRWGHRCTWRERSSIRVKVHRSGIEPRPEAD